MASGRNRDAACLLTFDQPELSPAPGLRGVRDPNRPPLARPSTCLSIRLRCKEGPLYWTSANKRDRYWNLGGILNVAVPRLLECGDAESVSGDRWYAEMATGMGKTRAGGCF